ncbi:hypothetical protein HCN44_008290 [Aphidius gifuensis]|uniref:Uncharacterized protein n=1 Tax=Aphidius gifuensis TaxID=684658 RepID=A0A834XP35_APHGI|nr:hypothetical protein HCN44_008290 [Aphidius gifuensis]
MNMESCCHHRDNLSSCQRPQRDKGNSINPKTRKSHCDGTGLIIIILAMCSLAHSYSPEYPTKVFNMIQERTQYGFGRDNRIRGTWSPWSSWSDCSKTCGIGVQSQARECIQPRGLRKRSVIDGVNSTSLKPICIGTYKRYHICNTQECSNYPEDSRAEQCAKYNGRMYKGESYNWIPFLNAPNPCSLNCRAVGQAFYATLEPNVIDGTPCDGPNVRGKSTGLTIDHTEQWLCVAGQCRPVGCDGVVGSGAIRDTCGICGGSGRVCKLFEGIFMEPNLPKGHQPVTIIPKGAMSLNISELRYSGNFLALKAENGSYILNGPYSVSPSGIYKVAGTVFTYQRGDKYRMECVIAAGPLNESISLEILYHEMNPGVLYKYMLPTNDLNDNNYDISPPLYTPGIQSTLIKCIKVDKDIEVPDRRCRRFEKPKIQSSTHCNDLPCPARWRADGWSECSVTCGTGVKTRKLECVQELNTKLTMRVAAGACIQPPDLTTIGTCHLSPCPEVRSMILPQRDTVPRWDVGNWSPCSSTCGKGIKNRTVTCITTREPCSQSTKPLVDKTCDTPCNNNLPSQKNNNKSIWLYSDWSSKCMTECEHKVETRKIACSDVSELFCDSEKKPATIKNCLNEKKKCHDDAKWFTGPWSSCSTMCGEGIIRREVICIGKSSGESNILSDNNCTGPKPQAEDTCRLSACQPEWYMSDWGECSASCGGGIKERIVKCIHDGVATLNCDSSTKPSDKISCNIDACPRDLIQKSPKKVRKCVDEYPKCASVIKAGLCRMKYYKYSCCGCQN